MRDFFSDPELAGVVAGVIGLLAVSSLIAAVLRRRVTEEPGRSVVTNLTRRINAWWAMVAVLALTLATGGIGSVLLFGALVAWPVCVAAWKFETWTVRRLSAFARHHRVKFSSPSGCLPKAVPSSFLGFR